MHHTKCALLVVFLLPALLAAEDLPGSISPPKRISGSVVFACLKSETFVMGGVLLSGKQAASRLFDGIGVQLRWSCPDRTGTEAAHNTILIRLAARVPRHFRKGTLAYALPFVREGVRITVFYDRLEPILEDHLAFAGSIFGHVLAHEIGHVLERVDSHAETGLMRAHWNEKDFVSMKFHAFGFTPEDAQSIRENVEREEPVE
jgi:hypothetical protein